MAAFGRRPGALALVGAVAVTVMLASTLVAVGATGYVKSGVSSKVSAVKHFGSTSSKHGSLIPSKYSSTLHQYGCEGVQKIKVRWHYKTASTYPSTYGEVDSYSKGEHHFKRGTWSKTRYVDCHTGVVAIGPQAMEGDLRVKPGEKVKVGYKFKLPYNSSHHKVTVSHAQIVFTPRCGDNPSTGPLVVVIPLKTYEVFDDHWIPARKHYNPLTFQAEFVVPDLCNGEDVRFDKGGTFTAVFTLS